MTWPFEQRNATTDFIYYFFIGFAAFPNVNPSWLTYWITFIGLQKPQELGSGEITPFITAWTVNKLICQPFEQHFYK